MRIHPLLTGRCCALVSAVGSVLHAAPPPVTFDGSLGARGSRGGANMIIPASRGRLVGNNLFHSFGRFDVPANAAARFQGPPQVHRVLARVTGGRASRIDGTLGCDIPNASLYLLNPNGVIFGPGAQVDVGGSFVVSTANEVGLADGGRFLSSTAGNGLLTTAPPASFGFVGPAAGVYVNSSTLRLAPGKPHTVAAGEVRISGGKILAPGGQISVVSTSGSATFSAGGAAGAVSTAAPETGLNDVSVINHGELSVTGDRGGTLHVQARHLDLDRGTLSARTGSHDALGGITIDLSGDLTARAGRIETGTDGSGNAGDVHLSARAVELAGLDWRPVSEQAGIDTASGSRSSATPEQFGGRAGNVRVAADTLRILDGAAIDTATYTRGDGGDIDVAVRNDAYFANEAGVLKSPPFNVVDAPLELRDTGIIARTYGAFAGAGTGGDVQLSTTNLTLGASGVVTTSTRALGDAGNVRVTVSNHLQITTPPDRPDGATASGGIFSQALPESPASPESGRGGSVYVRAGSIDILGERGAGIATTTRGNGDAGSVLVEAGDVNVRGPQGVIIAASLNSPPHHPVIDGLAGMVEMRVRSLTLTEGGAVSVQTASRGTTGDIVLRVRDKVIIREGAITATAAQTDGGNITLIAGTIEIDGAGENKSKEILASAFGNGGNLLLIAPDISLQNQATLSAEAGNIGSDTTPAAAASGPPGNGGNIMILTLPQRPDVRLFAQGGEINATAPGRGGRITVVAPNQTLIDTVLVASGGLAGDEGTIDVTSTLTDLIGSLVPVRAAIQSPMAHLHDACASVIARDMSSFVQGGAGGLPPDPGSWFMSEMGIDIRQLPEKRP